MKVCEFCGDELEQKHEESCKCSGCQKCNDLPTFCSVDCAMSWVEYMALSEDKAQVMN